MSNLPKRDPVRRGSPGWRVLEPDARRRVPVPPAWLDGSERRLWRGLWRSALGGLWDPGLDAHLVGDWFRLRRQVAERPGMAALHGQLRGVEDRLGLSPKARAAMRVELVDGPADRVLARVVLTPAERQQIIKEAS